MRGAITTPDGRAFLEIRDEPYVRQDGTVTTLRVWESQCAVCGKPFEVKAPATLTDLSQTKAFGMKHCADHKLTDAEVRARWRAGIKRAKTGAK